MNWGKLKVAADSANKRGAMMFLVLGALRSAFIFNLGQLLRRSPPLMRPWEANLVIVVRVFVPTDLNAQD